MKTRRRLLIAGIVVGALLTLSPFFGLLGTVVGMMRAFATFGRSGVTDPQTLSEEIGVTLISTAAGLFLCPIGIILFILSLIFFLNERPATPPPLEK